MRGPLGGLKRLWYHQGATAQSCQKRASAESFMLSLWQPRLTQTVEKRLEASRLHEESVIEPHAGNRGVGVNGEQAPYPCTSFAEPSEPAASCRLHAQGRRMIRCLLQRLVAPCRSLLIAPRHEMRVKEA